MPNGGSDNCMNCWFNRATRGARGEIEYWQFIDNAPEKQFCEIRHTAIPDPAYTHCRNMSYVSWGKPKLNPIPIGPIFVSEIIPGTFAYERVIWKASPDSDEVREYLLKLLDDALLGRDEALSETFPDSFFSPRSLAPMVIWQLAQIREQRALGRLQEISGNPPEWLTDPARAELQAILKDWPATPAD